MEYSVRNEQSSHSLCYVKWHAQKSKYYSTNNRKCNCNSHIICDKYTENSI